MRREQDAGLLRVATAEIVDLDIVLLNAGGKHRLGETSRLGFGDKGLDLILFEHEDNGCDIIVLRRGQERQEEVENGLGLANAGIERGQEESSVSLSLGHTLETRA